MSNLEKFKSNEGVADILKIILIFAIVGVAFTSIGATLVASDVLNMENQFLHFLSVTTEISKGQLVGTLIAAAVSLLFGGIITAFAYRYFTAELKEGTPLQMQVRTESSSLELWRLCCLSYPCGL